MKRLFLAVTFASSLAVVGLAPFVASAPAEAGGRSCLERLDRCSNQANRHKGRCEERCARCACRPARGARAIEASCERDRAQFERTCDPYGPHNDYVRQCLQEVMCPPRGSCGDVLHACTEAKSRECVDDLYAECVAKASARCVEACAE
ncbi:MAG: hypothetical protein H6741_30810 [Alphaproteobacteria bacterium]|nr:hypothetical protein [Alphaproteobacteria bacterium]